MTRNKRRDRITVEKVGDDCLDARELQRARVFRDTWITVRPSLRCPGIVQMRAARYLILLELLNQVGTQRIRVSWNSLPFRRIAALASLSVWAARGKAVQRNGRLFLPSVRRKPNVCQPMQEHQRSAPLRGLQIAPAPWRRGVNCCPVSRAPAWDA